MKKFLEILNSLAEETKNALNFQVRYQKPAKGQLQLLLLDKEMDFGFHALTFIQLRILIARGGVGADNLQFKLASNPIG